jgi:hypothetical protein
MHSLWLEHFSVRCMGLAILHISGGNPQIPPIMLRLSCLFPCDRLRSWVSTRLFFRYDLVCNNRGLTEATLATLGDPKKSLLLHRMKSTDPAVKMPPFLHNTPDTQATKIVEEWILKIEK